MFSRFERMVAGRFLRARRTERFVSVIALFSLIGIALGVATLIIVLSVMNGFRQELLDRVLGINGHLIVHAERAGEGIDGFDAIADTIRTLPRVTLVTPTIEAQAMATSSAAASGAIVRGVRPDELTRRSIIIDNLQAGDFRAFAGNDAVIVGSRLARRLGLDVGDDITLISPQGTPTPVGMVPRVRAYTIVATFEVGMFEYDNTIVFMPLGAAQTYFRLPDAVNQIEVFLDEPEAVDQVAPAVARTIADQGYVYTWQQAHAHFFNALQVERNVMFLILTLIILVAAFNIVSSLIMMVNDKGKGIAILRTVGATRGNILRIFFLTGATVGTLGTAIGFALGLGFSLNIETIRQWLEGLTGTELFAAEIYFLSRLPAEVDPVEVAMVVAMGLGLSFLATIYPAWRAARLDPVEALRYE